MRWWIYESWTHNRAIVHEAGCSYCRDGRGRQSKDSSKNGHWIGPFEDAEEAWAKAQSLGRETTTFCSQCGGRRISAQAGLMDRAREFEYASARAPETKMATREMLMQTSAKGKSPPGDDGKTPFERLYGCMKGTIKIMPGVDVTKPAYADDEWDELEAESDKRWDELLKSASNRKGMA